MIRDRGVLGAVGLAVTLAGCGDATQAMVTVDSEDEIRAEVTTLWIEVEAGDSVETLARVYEQPFDLPEFPHDVALVPANDDAGRVWRVTARAEGAAFVEITRGSAQGGYEEGALVRDRILLRGCPAACVMGERCEDGLCLPAM